jgi:guanylate kinase
MLEKDALRRKLWDLLPDHFTTANCHFTEPPPEMLNTPYHVSPVQFDDMVRNGQFVLHSTLGEFCLGITRQSFAAAAATRKIVAVEVDMRGVQHLKALPDFAARYVFIAPPSREVAQARWIPGRIETGVVQIHEPTRRALEGLRLDVVYNPSVDSIEVAYSRIHGVYDLVVPSDNLDEACQSLVNFIQSPGN